MRQLIKETLQNYIAEMPDISFKGKKVMGGDKPLKDLSVDEVMENIVIFREPTGNFMFGKGKTWGYFMDSPASANALAKGEIHMLMFPYKGRYDMSSSPITDVWKKRKKYQVQKGTEHILAIWEGYTDEEEIFVDKISVRPKYKKSSIASKMMDIFRRNYPDASINMTGVTDEGKEFVSKYTKVDKDSLYKDGETYSKDGEQYHHRNRFDKDLNFTNPKQKKELPAA